MLHTKHTRAFRTISCDLTRHGNERIGALKARAVGKGRRKGDGNMFCFDLGESFGPDGISLRGALEAGGP